MALRNKLFLALWLIGGASAWAQHAEPAAARPSRYGAIAGRLADARGIARAGVPVTIMRQDGLFLQKVYTGANGRFDLSRLLPGLYAVEVTLPDYLPFSKSNISVRAGAEVPLDIDLRTLAGSMRIGLPENAAQAEEDWKWTLRTAAPVRPILRFQDQPQWRQKVDVDVSGQHERPLRGTVLVSAGNEARGFGLDPGLRTIFDVVYDSTGNNALDMAGSAGWESNTPSAAFRAAWNHRSENGSYSSISATVEQLFLPSAYSAGSAIPDLPIGRRVQSMRGGYENETPLNSRTTLRYGAFFESVTLSRPMGQWSPFARITRAVGDQTWLTFGYTAEAPQLLPAGPGTSPGQVEQLLAIPQISSDVTGVRHPALEAGRHLEAAWERKQGSLYRFEAAAFYDSLSDVALSLSASGWPTFPAGLLRDPFSDTLFMDGGKYSFAGARSRLGIKLSNNSELIVGYSYSGGFRAASTGLTTETPQVLQDMLRTQREHSFVVKVRSTVPRIHTQIVTSYRWLPRDTVAAGDPYDSGIGRSEPYLNIAVVQPLPSPDILFGRFQAIADFHNLLAQGYLPIHGPNGAVSYFFPSARSFRGGFRFNF